MKYSHILWDFNGTVLDDVDVGIRAINTLLSRRNMKTLDSLEEYHANFGFPIIDYYRKLGFDFEREPYSEIAVEWVNEYNRLAPEAGLCPGVCEVYESFKAAGACQLIFSASEKQMLKGQLADLGLSGYFDDVLGCDNIEAHGKTALGIEWVKREKPQRALLIGDTQHDAEVAAKMGIECVLVARGHQAKEVLETFSVPVFDSLYEAAGYILGE